MPCFDFLSPREKRTRQSVCTFQCLFVSVCPSTRPPRPIASIQLLHRALTTSFARRAIRKVCMPTTGYSHNSRSFNFVNGNINHHSRNGPIKKIKKITETSITTCRNGWTDQEDKTKRRTAFLSVKQTILFSANPFMDSQMPSLI